MKWNDGPRESDRERGAGTLGNRTSLAVPIVNCDGCEGRHIWWRQVFVGREDVGADVDREAERG